MKTLLTLLLAISALACAGNDSPHEHPANSQAIEKQIYQAIGIVKKIDAGNGKITIDHEDIKGYMPAMEMDFSVGDKTLLESSKVGDRVDFVIERAGENLLVTKLTKIGEVAVIKGAEIYKINCSECHGASGEGVKKKGIPLVSGHALHHSEAEHIKQVSNGEGEKMPAFRDKLGTEEIKAVVDYVRNEIQKNTQREDSHQHKH